ncbi:MAG: tetratricopeptide repeat protein [Elusimicrobiota bacterium]
MRLDTRAFAFSVLSLSLVGQAMAAAPSARAKKVFRQGVRAYELARMDTAEVLLTRAMDMHPGWKTAAGFRAIVRWEQKDNEGARYDATQALGLKPKDAESFTARGLARVVMDMPDGAAEDFIRAAKKDPKHVPAYLGMAVTRGSQHMYEEALTNLNMALGKAPATAMAYVLRGRIREAMGENESASEDYTSVLRLNPGYTRAYFYRGRARVNLGDYARALDDINAYLARHPDSAEALYQRGSALYSLGELQAASRDMNKVISMEPGNGLAFANRGMVRDSMGDKAGALADMRKAMDLAPEKRAALRPQVDRLMAELGGEPEEAYEAEDRYEARRGTAREPERSTLERLGNIVRNKVSAQPDQETAVKPAQPRVMLAKAWEPSAERSEYRDSLAPEKRSRQKRPSRRRVMEESDPGYDHDEDRYRRNEESYQEDEGATSPIEYLGGFIREKIGPKERSDEDYEYEGRERVSRDYASDAESEAVREPRRGAVSRFSDFVRTKVRRMQNRDARGEVIFLH